MTDDHKAVGLSPYSGRKPGRPGVCDVLQMLQRKVELRALLEAEQEKIAAALPNLNPDETQQLLSLMATEVKALDGDPAIAAVTEEAAYAAQGIRALTVTLSRPASKALQSEVVRRIHQGNYCPPTELLLSEAVRRAFGNERR